MSDRHYAVDQSKYMVNLQKFQQKCSRCSKGFRKFSNSKLHYRESKYPLRDDSNKNEIVIAIGDDTLDLCFYRQFLTRLFWYGDRILNVSADRSAKKVAIE